MSTLWFSWTEIAIKYMLSTSWKHISIKYANELIISIIENQVRSNRGLDQRPNIKFLHSHFCAQSFHLKTFQGRFHEVLYGTIVQVFWMIPYFFRRKSEINFGMDNCWGLSYTTRKTSKMETEYCSNNCEKYMVLYGTSEKTLKMTFDYMFDKVCELIITM